MGRRVSLAILNKLDRSRLIPSQHTRLRFQQDEMFHDSYQDEISDTLEIGISA